MYLYHSIFPLAPLLSFKFLSGLLEYLGDAAISWPNPPYERTDHGNRNLQATYFWMIYLATQRELCLRWLRDLNKWVWALPEHPGCNAPVTECAFCLFKTQSPIRKKITRSWVMKAHLCSRAEVTSFLWSDLIQVVLLLQNLMQMWKGGKFKRTITAQNPLGLLDLRRLLKVSVDSRVLGGEIIMSIEQIVYFSQLTVKIDENNFGGE